MIREHALAGTGTSPTEGGSGRPRCVKLSQISVREEFGTPVTRAAAATLHRPDGLASKEFTSTRAAHAGSEQQAWWHGTVYVG